MLGGDGDDAGAPSSESDRSLNNTEFSFFGDRTSPTQSTDRGFQPMLTRLRPSSVINRSSAINPNRIIRTTQARSYSSESDRKPKSGGTVDSADPDHPISTSSTSEDPTKPIVISGRGRRASHRSAQSNGSKQYGYIPKLALPFTPLSSNHLAHLKPTTLSLDLFFSLQRPLLEIELGPDERRSITSESKQSKLDLETEQELSTSSSSAPEEAQDDLDYSHITSGSPSDPAFKPPHTSSARPPPQDDNELAEQLWSTNDPYSAYLIAEPDGVHPAWSDALKRCLANSQAFVPPPEPSPKQETLSNRVESETAAKQDGLVTLNGKEAQMERDRQGALKYLNPYGSITDKNESTEEQDGSNPDESNTLPQDQLSLTMQAARFLHSGMMSNRWPNAANWAAIDSRLTAATESYSPNPSSSSDSTTVKEFTDSFPAIRSQEPKNNNSGRRNRNNQSKIQQQQQSKLTTTILGENGTGKTFTFNTEQLTQIIKYSQKIIKNKLAIESIPKPILKNLERFGEYLIHKHRKSFSNVKEEKNDVLNSKRKNKKMDSKLVGKESDSVIGSSTVPIVIIDPSAETLDRISDPSGATTDSKDGLVIDLDSVFRKKKRKMKVHKYKKRRKARRVLKKRQAYQSDLMIIVMNQFNDF
ncbi:hypothetical protein H4Q26_006982 [Puccinia striiformis f. sp. tritici PST-130]|nr:hypothetical protein H4Q26_006982 [Puccinia striiformis f. sp. tritici PST-130]